MKTKLKDDIKFGLLLALLGFILSTHLFLSVLNTLNPLEIFIVYYIIFFGGVFLLTKLKIKIGGIKFNTGAQAIGATLIFFSWALITNWTSCWTQYAVGLSCSNISSIFIGSEDGVTFFLWNLLVNNYDIARILTYIITPFILGTIGSLLIVKRITLRP